MGTKNIKAASTKIKFSDINLKTEAPKNITNLAKNIISLNP